MTVVCRLLVYKKVALVWPQVFSIISIGVAKREVF